MRAITVVPGTKDSHRLEDVPEPPDTDGSILVDVLAVGVCGTDLEIVAGAYGWVPPGKERMILGHESLGRVREAPSGSGFAKGDLVVGIVRRPDPVPCPNCAVDEWDMCQNGRYTERGIKERDGYASQRYRIEPRYLVKLDPALGRVGVLLEPASVLAKAWDQVERIGSRARWTPKKVLVTGAGPIGLLAALMGVQRGLEVHVLDRVEDGPKPALVRDLGATYHTGDIAHAAPGADVVIECTGVGSLVFDAMAATGPNGIVCLTGVSSGKRSVEVNGATLNKSMVLQNDVVVGSVNANRRHYEAAAQCLAKADARWLERIVSRRVPFERYAEAFTRRPDDVKTVIEFESSGRSGSATA